MQHDPPPTPARRFRIADAMILMAALFLALAWDRGRMLNPLRQISDPSGTSGLLWRLSLAAADAIEQVPPILGAFSVSTLTLRMLTPRPPLRRLLRQPGTIACAAATLFLVPTAAAVLGSHLAEGRPFEVAWSRTARDLRPEYFTGAAAAIGLAVAIAWIALAASQRWRPEPSWIDRLGRLLGACWIAMIPGGIFVALIRFSRTF
jgi:hypothetical protein